MKFIEKPDTVSWDDIHNVVWVAHADNRAKGIFMAYPTLPGEAIKEKLGEKGKMFVAMDGEQVVGTAAYMVKKDKVWYTSLPYVSFCFASVLPEYTGMGIFQRLTSLREKTAIKEGWKVLIFDTNEKNEHIMRIHSSHGFQRVALKVCTDHFNVVMAKWSDGSPYPKWYCNLRFIWSSIKNKTRYHLSSNGKMIKRF